MSGYDLVQRADGALARIERALVVLVTGALVTVMMVQVVLRYFFSAPLFWAEEFSVQMMVFMTLFGVSLLTHHQSLVAVDLLPQALPERARTLLQLLLGLCMLAILSFFCWLALRWITKPEVRLELGATLRVPRWYNYSVLPAALVLTIFHQVAGILRSARTLIKPSPR